MHSVAACLHGGRHGCYVMHRPMTLQQSCYKKSEPISAPPVNDDTFRKQLSHAFCRTTIMARGKMRCFGMTTHIAVWPLPVLGMHVMQSAKTKSHQTPETGKETDFAAV